MRRVLVRSALAVTAVLAGLVVYGVLVEPRLILDERRYTASTPHLGED